MLFVFTFWFFSCTHAVIFFLEYCLLEYLHIYFSLFFFGTLQLICLVWQSFGIFWCFLLLFQSMKSKHLSEFIIKFSSFRVWGQTYSLYLTIWINPLLHFALSLLFFLTLLNVSRAFFDDTHRFVFAHYLVTQFCVFFFWFGFLFNFCRFLPGCLTCSMFLMVTC